LASNRLVIIGLDAADYQLVRAFMAEGDLPRLSAMGVGGAFARLQSSIPPQTGPAWTSITTGVNPGKHGIYYFYNFATSPITIVNSTNTSTPRIWDYVGALGERSVVLNVPITYPAQEIQGSLVSGIPPWYFDGRSVYPGGLFSKLKDHGYEIDTPMSRGLEGRPNELVTRVIRTEDRRVALFLELLKRAPWSFAMIVLTGLDRLQHKALGNGEDADEAVRRGYREVDALVGKIADTVGADVNKLVVSDHGFNFRPLAFYPNSWLYEQGLLRRKSSVRNRLARAAHDLLDGHLLWLPQSLTKRFQGAATSISTIDAVDLGTSRAFVPGTDGVVVVRSKEDEDAIAEGLSSLRDGSGKEVCRVYRRDQVYHGDRVTDAPQLLIVPRDDINIRTDPFSEKIVSAEGDFPKGNHSPNGIFFAEGPGIKRSSGMDLRLEDIAPTVLTLLGIRPPESLDGRTVEELLADARGTVSLRHADVGSLRRAYAFSDKEEKQVMDNLKRLGYT
jgi:predicted AlkP superfamily phosphohydrolase/phosphomutase